jgi:hypothetical protein
VAGEDLATAEPLCRACAFTIFDTATPTSCSRQESTNPQVAQERLGRSTITTTSTSIRT